jgi:putative SOS response-associated peptidase YedK
MHEQYSLSDTALLTERFAGSIPAKAKPSYEAVAGAYLPVALKDGIHLMRWGIRPDWAVRKNSPFSKTAQPREEIMAEIMKNRQRQRKVSYRRCVVPATTFYEIDEAGLTLKHDAPAGTVYGLAGTFESWTDENGHENESFALITVLRHRRETPIVLNPKAEAIWLDPIFFDWHVLGSILQIPKDAPAYRII